MFRELSIAGGELHCNRFAASLQIGCSATAKLLQRYCKYGCSVTAKLLQRYCKYGCSVTAKLLQNFAVIIC
jgi:hypothetical protein